MIKKRKETSVLTANAGLKLTPNFQYSIHW